MVSAYSLHGSTGRISHRCPVFQKRIKILRGEHLAMTGDTAIRVHHISKTFKLPHEKHTSIKGALINRFKGNKRSFERQEVLKDVSFEVRNGEFFGIVCRN